jgi:hypothetical protein
LKVDKTISEIQVQFNFDDDKVLEYIFDKLESERSLFWIQVARTVSNRMRSHLKYVEEGYDLRELGLIV